MSIINHITDADFTDVLVCPHCKKPFAVYAYLQTPGLRETEELICPHCGKILKTSMEWEYITTKEIPHYDHTK